MDLGTVKRKVAEGRYASVFDAAEDVRLVWKNCVSDIHYICPPPRPVVIGIPLPR